jgi:hypothetical protein
MRRASRGAASARLVLLVAGVAAVAVAAAATALVVSHDGSSGPSAPPSRTAGPRVLDQPITAAAEEVMKAILAYQADHGAPPPVAAVRPSGALRAYLHPWPLNAYDGRAMRPGAGPGGYTYTVAGNDFSLVIHLQDGRAVPVPSPSP